MQWAWLTILVYIYINYIYIIILCKTYIMYRSKQCSDHFSFAFSFRVPNIAVWLAACILLSVYDLIFRNTSAPGVLRSAPCRLAFSFSDFHFQYGLAFELHDDGRARRWPTFSFSHFHFQYGPVFSFTMMGKTFTYLVGAKASALFFNSRNEQLNAELVYGKLTTPVFGKGVAYDCPNSVHNMNGPHSRTASHRKLIVCG